MKKVTIFIPSLAMAGAEKVVTDLALHIDKSDLELTVALTTNGDATYFYHLLMGHGINVIDLSASGNKLLAVFNIIHFLIKHQPDVIHAHVAALQYLAFPVLLVPVKKKLYTVHGAAHRLAESPLRKLLYNFCFKVLNFRTVAISNFVKETIHTEYKIPLSEIVLISNGVDLTRFVPQKKQNERFRIISVGRFNTVKNHDLLLDAFYLVHKKYPDVELMLPGEGHLKKELIRKIEDYNLQNSVMMPGNISEVQNFLAQSDLYVGTSFYEGFSLTAVEAMACGLPVVFTKAGGVSDIVKDNSNGFLCNYNAQELAEKIIYLMENKDALEGFSKAALQTAKEFDVKIFADKYRKLYLS